MRPVSDTVGRDITQAANGVNAILRCARDDSDAAALAYIALYACGFSGRSDDLDRYRALPTLLRDETFVTRLVAEVADTVEITNWTVVSHDGDRVLLSYDGIRAFVECRALLTPARPGETAVFLRSVLRTGVMPGFVVRSGASPVIDRSNVSRLYLNICPAGAVWALGALGRRLDQAGVPYELKVLSHPKAYLRRDACVLYVGSDTEAEVSRLVIAALDEVGGAPVRPARPRLTAPVIPGVSVAHEPTDIAPAGLSHGQWVAGIFQTAARRCTEPRAIATEVRSLIVQAGRDPSQPHRRGDGPGPEPGAGPTQ